VDAWAARARPRLGGEPIAVTTAEVTDPQSGRRYGTAVTIRRGRGDAAAQKTLVFIADLTPVNFLFYGVPTEGIDRVMAQLLTTTLRLVRDVGGRRPPAPRLYAVDRELPS
jgi:hypothetical protein